MFNSETDVTGNRCSGRVCGSRSGRHHGLLAALMRAIFDHASAYRPPERNVPVGDWLTGARPSSLLLPCKAPMQSSTWASSHYSTDRRGSLLKSLNV